MKGPEVSGQPCRLFDAVYLLIDVCPFPAFATGEDVRTFGPWMGSEKFPGLAIQRYLLVLSPFGVPDVDKSPLKVNINPSEPQKLSPAHAGKEGHFHQMGYLHIGGLLQGLQEPGHLIRSQILSFDIICPGHLDGEGGGFAKMFLGGEIQQAAQDFRGRDS
jgi:hypothetical protein